MRKLIMTRSIFAGIIILNLLSRNSATPTVPAMYIFGDSILDSGNNNLLPTLAKVNYPPYGMNFPAGATGRFTNGRTAADFIAEFLGLPYVPPYISILGAIQQLDQLIGISLTRALLRLDQLTGQNFASGTCGILPESGRAYGKCLNIVDQVNLFETIVQKDLPAYYRNSSQLSDYLSRSLYVISVGSNDYINNYLDTQNYTSSKVYSPESFAQLLIDRLSVQLKRLYNLGARKVIMFELGPIGCIPSISRQFKHTGLCNEDINQLQVLFNNRLAPMLQSLTSTLNGSDFILGQIYKLSYDSITNPSNYGLNDTTNPCCVALLNGTSVCIPGLGALACRDPEKHYFWDGFHPTETVYRTIASRCINGSSVCVPKSIKQLVQQL